MILRLINQTELEKNINSTPTGPERNALCDFNIMVQANGKEVESEDVFISKKITEINVQDLDDSDYYYVVTSGGYKEHWKGHIIKASPNKIQSILIQQ